MEVIVPLVVPHDRGLLQRLEAGGVTATTCYPFTYTLGPTSTLDQKRDAMMHFADQTISKLRGRT